MRAGLEAEADRLARGVRRPMRRAAEMLRLARGRVRRWPLGDLEWKHLAREIRRTYRQGRKALETYQREKTPEAFHAWRKRVKELWYHLRIAENWLPKTVGEQIARCDEIGEIAGNAHDLFLLRETMFARKAGAEAARLSAAIEVRMEELQQAALECGIRLHAEKPGAFAQRLLSRRRCKGAAKVVR